MSSFIIFRPQSGLKSGHVSRVAPRHRLLYFSRVYVSPRCPTRQPKDSAAQHSHYAHASHRCLTRVPEHSALRYFHRTYVSHHNLKRLPERSQFESSLTRSHRMAPPGSPDFSASRLHLEWVFHMTNLVLALHEPVWPPEHFATFNFSLFSWWSRHDTRFQRSSPCVVHSFHFFRVEVHLSLLCSNNPITTRWVCLTRCLNSDATIL